MGASRTHTSMHARTHTDHAHRSMYVLRDGYLYGPESECTFLVYSESGEEKNARLRVLLGHGPPARLRAELRGLPAEAEVAGAGDADVVRFESAATGGGEGGITVIRRWPRSCRVGAVAIQVGTAGWVRA